MPNFIRPSGPSLFSNETLANPTSSPTLSPNTPTPPPGNVIDDPLTFSAPDLITDVSVTPIPGTILYDEVIPFSLTTQGSGGTTVVSTTGALQSRVIRSNQTNTLVFAYRFRDLVFNPNAPGQSGNNFIELVTLRGFETNALPLSVYNVDPSQSLGGEVWSGGPNVTIGANTLTDVKFEWNAYYTKPDGTTFVAFASQVTKYKTGAYMGVGDQAFGHATLSGIAVPDP